jgi:DNA-binding MarR family transcriptional regulator
VDTTPLTTLLSQTFVAFTIECDNEFEQRMPHRTATRPPPSNYPKAPWLVSMAMWWHCMRYVDKAGVTVRELERRSGTATNLGAMQRWGYVVIEHAGPDRQVPGAASVVRPTAAGRRAQQVWKPLETEIEQRWADRFGTGALGDLRHALEELAPGLDPNLPDGLPVQHYGLFTRDPRRKHRALGDRDADDTRRALPVLLARPLVAIAYAYEADSSWSLSMGANILRVLDEAPIRNADLPRLGGVSKEGVAMALGVLEKTGAVRIDPDPDRSRGKVVRLTALGRHARRSYLRHLAEVEDEWVARLGVPTTPLREALVTLVGSATLASSPLATALVVPPTGWRAARRAASTLPHFPMVLHRGGYPDGE